MDASADTIAEETLFALETRLRRLEFVLQGSSGDPICELHALGGAGQRNSVSARLNALERDLIKLSAKSPTVKDMLDLHANFPEIFGNVHPIIQTSTLSSEEKLSTILSAAPSFHATSSQLTSIMDTPIPSPSTSTDLIGLAPRINKVEVVQQVQAKEIGELRKRSAKLLERWYLFGIEGVNECFAEWDERTLEVDKLISRKIKVVENS